MIWQSLLANLHTVILMPSQPSEDTLLQYVQLRNKPQSTDILSPHLHDQDVSRQIFTDLAIYAVGERHRFLAEPRRLHPDGPSMVQQDYIQDGHPSNSVPSNPRRFRISSVPTQPPSTFERASVMLKRWKMHGHSYFRGQPFTIPIVSGRQGRR